MPNPDENVAVVESNERMASSVTLLAGTDGASDLKNIVCVILEASYKQ